MQETLRYIIQLIFGIFLAFYGGYIAIAAIRNNKRFVNSYKRLDLIKLFGDFGRVLYVVIGIIICIAGVMICFTQIKNLL